MGKLYMARLSRNRHGLFYVMDNGRTIAFGPRFKNDEETRAFARELNAAFAASFPVIKDAGGEKEGT